MTDDLDTQLAVADPDRWLSSRFVADADLRADIVALYAFDHELARAPKAASNTLLGEIRLTWWREVLDEAFEGRPVRHHPTAKALAAAIQRHDLPREPLDAMIDARYRELDPTPMAADEITEWARDTGGAAAVLTARMLDPAGDAEAARDAGAAWASSFRGVSTKLKTPRLSASAFPAVAHAVFAADRAAGRVRSDVSRRLRITWAVATGWL